QRYLVGPTNPLWCTTERHHRARTIRAPAARHGSRPFLRTRYKTPHFRFAAVFSRLTPSLARRFAVRCSAATLDAFFARAFRSSGVIFFAAVLPPCLPNLR